MQVTVISNGKTRIADLEHTDELTPETAIRFRNLAFGLDAPATVTDGNLAYRVTGYCSQARAVEVKVPEGHEVPTQEVIKKCAWCQYNEPTIP